MEGANNQNAGEQGRQVRQNVKAIDHDSTGAILAKDSLQKMAMKKIRKKKEMKSKVNNPTKRNEYEISAVRNE